MNILLKLIAGTVADFTAGEIKSALSPLAPYLRKLGVGFVIILVSFAFWFTGLLFLLVGLFLYLSHLDAYLAAALWCGVISLLGAGGLLLAGLKMLKSPRRF